MEIQAKESLRSRSQGAKSSCRVDSDVEKCQSMKCIKALKILIGRAYKKGEIFVFKRFWKMKETKLKNRVVCHGSKQKVTLNLNSDYFSFQGPLMFHCLILVHNQDPI